MRVIELNKKRFIFVAQALVLMALVLFTPLACAADWPMFRHDAAHSGVAGESVEPPLEVLWKYETGDSVASSPAVSGGVVYVGSHDSYVYALDASSGSLKWKYKTDDRVLSSPVVSGGVVYVGSDDGNIYAFTPASAPTPTPTTGTISVSSTPSGASIYLDGSYQGKTPITIPDVYAGSHYIELKLEGYNPWSDRINVMTGSTSYISVQLIPTATIPTITPTYTILPTPIPSSIPVSVNLHGEKTDVVLGEDILLKLSAVNLITKPKMHVQVIIIPPSGMSVTSSEFSKSGAGQFTANYELEPGDGRDIEVRIRSNQVGDFNVKGRIIYYFGEEKDKAEDQTLNLPIKVRKEIASTLNSIQNTGTKPAEKSPGFEIILAGVGMFLALSFRRR